MQNPATEQRIDVVDGRTYSRNLAQLTTQHPNVEADVKDVLEKLVKPAIRQNPILPHQEGGGTPIIKGILAIRVPDSSGGKGKRGGFRLIYHWNRQQERLTKLSISLRRDQSGLSAQVADDLLAELNKN
ncbi:MAG: hypothetical protein IVW54_20395 [Candidatus Binataceae bacterium]|nr:hypothetical protein [Candidatus Binataceae bacterium]